jgi:hypothetical protein
MTLLGSSAAAIDVELPPTASAQRRKRMFTRASRRSLVCMRLLAPARVSHHSLQRRGSRSSKRRTRMRISCNNMRFARTNDPSIPKIRICAPTTIEIAARISD